MSKIVCEICGTAYSSADAQCPVCGFEKPVTADFADACARGNTGPVAVPEKKRSSKGGRYTKANVTKRLSANGKPGSAPKNPTGKPRKKRRSKKRDNSNRGLVVLIVILLIGILLVGGYLLLKYLRPDILAGLDFLSPQTTTEQTDPQQNPADQTDAPGNTTVPTETENLQPSETETEPDLSCKELKLTENTIRFNKPGNAWLLNVIVTPADTTDTVTFHSEDESVATVDVYGRVVAVGAGETEIVITCGDVSIKCKVSCKEGAEETKPQQTEPDETEPEETKPVETKPVDMSDFKLNREDFSLNIGEKWQLYDGSIDPADITWTSSNTSVATVSKGLVKGVGKGTAWITAEYNGVTLKCIVRVGNL